MIYLQQVRWREKSTVNLVQEIDFFLYNNTYLEDFFVFATWESFEKS